MEEGSVKLIPIIAIFACMSAQADSWTGKDKVLHLTGGAALGAAVLAATKSEGYALAAGCGAGVVKEVWDAKRQNHTPSVKDAAVTCVGAYIGIKASGVVLTARGINYSKVF